MNLAVVTATLDYPRAEDCITSWLTTAQGDLALYLVGQKPDTQPRDWEPIAQLGPYVSWGYRTPQILGVVPAFAIGVQKALEDGADVIACFHDDLEIQQEGWDLLVTDLFERRPTVGLVGFGGGVGLGADDIYQVPYDPMQLARQRFISNMRDAEAHGERVTEAQRVSVLDGFSQIGRREYWLGWTLAEAATGRQVPAEANLFAEMQRWGIIHHAYDAALGCFARRLGWEVWMLPVACHHHGGLTAVADPRYHAWANDRPLYADHRGKVHRGDQAFWAKAHRIVYDQFTDVLPIRVT
jgi:hypothetical protein